MNKTTIWLILGYVGSLALAGGGGYYLYEEYKLARDEEASLKKQIELADIKIKTIPGLETDVICLRENVTEVVKILPDTKEVNEFVNKINDFAFEAGVDIHSLIPEKDRNQGKGKNKGQAAAFDKVIYKVKMKANLPQCLDFLSSIEGYERFVRVTSLDLGAGNWDKDMPREDVRHEIAVDLETYAYRGNDGKSQINIQNYDARRVQLADEIVSRRAEIKVEHYDYIGNPLRRDPFVDPRIRLTDIGEGGLPYLEQKALVEGLVVRAEAIRDLVKSSRETETNFVRRLELDKAIDDQLDSLKVDLDATIAGDQITDLALKRRVERDVMSLIKEFLGRETPASQAVTLDELRRYRTDMGDMLERHDYESVITKHEYIEGRVDTGSMGPEAASILQQIDMFNRTAEAALDFQGKDIAITGAVVQETNSVCVVNGTVLREGDSLEEGLVIHRIREDRIEFRFRGVVLAKAH